MWNSLTRLVGHNCKRKRRFWLRRYLLSRLPKIPPCLKGYCVIARTVIAADMPNRTCVYFLLWFLVCLCSLPLSWFALEVSPCPSLCEWGFFFFSVVVVGVHYDDMFAESIKKEQKNKRKTQKLGWLWEPDRSCERKAGDRHRGISSGFSFRLPIASSLQNRVPFVVVLCLARAVDSIREKSKTKR